MQNPPARTRLFHPARLAVAAACFTIAAHGGPLSVTSLAVQVAGGSLVNSSSSTSWGGLFPSVTATTASETWEYGDTSSSGIFLLPSSSNIFGLTNSEFRCGLGNVSGCGGLGITFTLLGVAVSSLPVSGNLIIGLDGSTTFSGALQALYAVSDSGPTVVPLSAPSGSIPLSSTAGAFTASNAGTPVLFSCSFCSSSGLLVNITIFLLIEPSTAGARFLDGDTVTLPSSFAITVADVPEPASGVIAGLALAALGTWRRVRTSARKRDHF
jgi:hypothetical protein